MQIVDVFAHILTPRYLRERNARAGSRFGTQYAQGTGRQIQD